MKCKVCGINETKKRNGVPNTTCSKECQMAYMRNFKLNYGKKGGKRA